MSVYTFAKPERHNWRVFHVASGNEVEPVECATLSEAWEEVAEGVELTVAVAKHVYRLERVD